MRIRPRPLLRILAGTVLGGGALWLTLRDISARQLAGAFSHVNAALALGALASSMAAVALFALRWKLLFAPEYRDV